MTAVGLALYGRVDTQGSDVQETSLECPCCPGATEGALDCMDFTL